MKALALAVVVGLIAIVASNAQPSVSALQNNYSYVLPGMPNYGIAQGSIFVMYGKNMGPSQIASAQSFLDSTKPWRASQSTSPARTGKRIRPSRTTFLPPRAPPFCPPRHPRATPPSVSPTIVRPAPRRRWQW